MLSMHLELRSNLDQNAVIVDILKPSIMFSDVSAQFAVALREEIVREINGLVLIPF